MKTRKLESRRNKRTADLSVGAVTNLEERVDFSIAILARQIQPKSRTAQRMFEELQAAHDQAVLLVRLFNEQHYLTVDAVEDALKRSKFGAVSLIALLGFLVGYLSAEDYRSQFDHDVFGGSISSIMDKKVHPVGAALSALFAFVEKTEQTSLPDRRTTAKKHKRRSK